jgi:hypothetical protein
VTGKTLEDNPDVIDLLRSMRAVFKPVHYIGAGIESSIIKAKEDRNIAYRIRFKLFRLEVTMDDWPKSVKSTKRVSRYGR